MYQGTLKITIMAKAALCWAITQAHAYTVIPKDTMGALNLRCGN